MAALTSALAVTEATVRIGAATILDAVSIAVPPSSMTVIIGPNGAGKSTLLAVAAGERRPTSGVVRLGGDAITRLSARQLARRRAVMPQDTTVAFPFTVREVVAMGRTAYGDRAENDAIVDETLSVAELVAFQDRPVNTLSGGEQQRVALARVIAQATPIGEDSVILLDEPTAAMDIAHAEVTLHLARDLARRGAAVVAVLHDLDAAAAYADRVILMDRGRVRQVGTVAEVCTARALTEVYGTPIEVYPRDGRLRVAPARGGRGTDSAARPVTNPVDTPSAR